MDAFFILTEYKVSAMGCLHELYSLCVQNQDFFPFLSFENSKKT